MILVISSYYHDSATALVGESGIIAAAQKVRFPIKKFDLVIDDETPMPKVDWVIDCAANPSVLAGLDGQSSSR